MFFNESIFNLFYSIAHKSAFIDVVIAFFAQYLIYLMIPAAAVLILLERDSNKRRYFISLGIFSVILSRGIILPVLNFLFYNPRPFIALDTVEPLVSYGLNSSIPSGHMMVAMPIAMTILCLNKNTGLWFLGLSIIMGAARVMAGVHWPLDILAGIVLGASCFYLAQYLFRLRGLEIKG